MTRATSTPPPRPAGRVFGPVVASLVLHSAALGLAATVGFTLAAERDEPEGELGLALAPSTVAPEPPALPGPEGRDELPPPFQADPIEAAPDGDFLAALPPPPEEPEPDETLEATLVTLEPLSADALTARAGDGSDGEAPAGPPANHAALGLGARGGNGAGTSAATGGAPSASALALLAPVGAPRTGKVGTGAGDGGAPRLVVVEEARLLEKHAPAYPRLSTRSGEEGAVTCRMHISVDGTVTLVDVITSSGFERLDEAARGALLRWRFAPRRLDGRAVPSTLEHTVRFQLDARSTP